MSDPCNEPAFPVQDAASWQSHGMTLRDYFAAQSLAGLLTRVWNLDGSLTGEQVIQQWATSAYAVADAMLAEREKDSTQHPGGAK